MKRNVLTAPVLKTVRWGLMCLALCLASMPANAADEMANTLVYAGENEDTINPLLNNHQELPTIIFSGLMKYDAKGQPVPELAESFTYDKGAHTYAFKLRNGVKWHDGKPLTVEDILFTYEALTKDKTLASSITSNYEDIKSITAPDAQTVVFTLSKPNAAMLDNFTIGILPNILNTVYLVGVTLIITLPLGVGAAIYLTEYARNRRLVAAIEFATETLTGIPSIIFGLVGMLFFCQLLGLQASLLAGSLTLVIVTIPTIIRTTQESLKTVPQSFREAALGLGAGKWHMIRTVVLPSSVDGIVTGCILAIGRIVGESAALLFTAGMGMSLNNFFGSVGNFIHSSGASLTVALYVYARERAEFDVAFAIAAILMLLTLVINLSAKLVGRTLKKK
mgnify:CR=1 FL=1